MVNKVRFVSGMQNWFNTLKAISKIHNINKINDKTFSDTDNDHVS